MSMVKTEAINTCERQLNLEVITSQLNTELDIEEKCDIVMDKVMKGKAVLFEGGLKPSEQARMIEESMKKVDHETFFGIKIHSPTITIEETNRGLFSRSKSKAKYSPLTIISPVDLCISVHVV